MIRSLLAAGLLFPAAALARLDSPVTDRAEAQAKQALALAHSPRSAAYLLRLRTLRDEVDDLNLLAQTYSSFLNRRGTDPLARELVISDFAELERARGHLTK